MLYAAPGNPGTAAEQGVQNMPDLNTDDHAAVRCSLATRSCCSSQGCAEVREAGQRLLHPALHGGKASSVAFDAAQVADFCRDNGVELVVIGPEAPLVAGLADSLSAAGIEWVTALDQMVLARHALLCICQCPHSTYGGAAAILLLSHPPHQPNAFSSQRVWAVGKGSAAGGLQVLPQGAVRQVRHPHSGVPQLQGRRRGKGLHPAAGGGTRH